MEISTNKENASVLNLLQCKCPRCRRGDMFSYSNPYDLKNFMKMNEVCPVCGQIFDIEVGFYYGTSFVSYALTVAFSGFTFAVWWFLIGFGLEDNRIFYWLGANALLLLAMQPLFMRFSRTLWLAFFVRYDAYWRIHPAKKPERTNKDQMNAW